MPDEVMDGLLAKAASSWQQYRAAIQAVQEYGNSQRVTVARRAGANPALVQDVYRAAEAFLSDNPELQFNTEGLANVLAEVVNASPKTLQNVYLPAIRDTFPHCIKSGRRTWLWFYGAASPSATGFEPKAPTGAVNA